jgi:putative ABC transport system permease protein
VLRVALEADSERPIAVTSAPYAPALQTDYPQDIEAVLRVLPTDGLVTYGDKSFREENIYLADANFFDFFSYPLLEGDPALALQDPHSIVITQAMAQKYFGDENPLGKTLIIDQELEFHITGVLDEFPSNTHLKFDFLASVDLLKNRSWFSNWWSNSFFTYVMLREGIAPGDVISRLPDFMEKYLGKDFERSGRRMGLTLEALPDIYLNNQSTFDKIPHGDRQVIYLFTLIALFILLIAAINYMNLATARSSKRAMEVGLRKVMGAYRRNLLLQFLSESVILTFISVILAIGLLELILPYFNDLFNLDLSLRNFTGKGALLLLAGILFTGIISGSYPAVFLSSFRPVEVMKGVLPGSGNAVMRKMLVTAQFAISIALIAFTVVIFRQMNFISGQKLGFDEEQVILVPMTNDAIYRERERFKNELLREPGIVSVSAVSGAPGGFHDYYSFGVQNEPEKKLRMRTVFTDENYLGTFNIPLIAGRNFSPERAADVNGAVILNESAVRELGWSAEEAPGKVLVNFPLGSLQQTVIGVVKDYHFSSLKLKIQPLAITMNDMQRVFAIKVRPGNLQERLTAIEKAWDVSAPGFPFEYEFLDRALENLYRAERKQQVIFSVFAFVAISIACLGLFGLATYAAEQRTREIGIRKVLGASAGGLVMLLSKDFLKLVIIAFALAVPVSYYAMKQWLQDFAYRITIDAGIFLLAGSIALLIALATVSYQAIKAALANPVEALRYE